MKFFFPLLLLLMNSNIFAKVVLYSAAGLYEPMQKIVLEFEKTENSFVEVFYAGSGELFGRLGFGAECDVFVPASKKYLIDAVNTKLINKTTIIDIIEHYPVLVVSKNTEKILNFEDIIKSNVRIAIGDPKSTAIGVISKKILNNNRLSIKPVVLSPTVNQLIIYVSLGSVDGVIVWRELTQNKNNLRIIEIPNNQSELIATAIATKSKNVLMAKKLNKFIGSKKAKRIFRDYGF